MKFMSVAARSKKALASLVADLMCPRVPNLLTNAVWIAGDMYSVPHAKG